MRVEQSQQAELITAQAGRGASAAKRAKTPFATVLAKTASTTTTGTSGSNTTATTDKADGKKAIPKGPKGETTQAVKDHPAYVEVTSGPRNGMFINMTNNERRGEAFTLVRKDDRDLHIYGTGKNRRVIISWHKDQPAHADEYKADGTKQASEKTDASSSTGGASIS